MFGNNPNNSEGNGGKGEGNGKTGKRGRVKRNTYNPPPSV